MGAANTPGAPIFDPYTFGKPGRPTGPELKPLPPLPWIYRDPQRWLLPSLTLAAIVIAAAIAEW